MRNPIDWLISFAKKTPYVHIPPESGTYMERYWLFRLFRKPDSEYGWIDARVHVIKSSDDARAYHDHPWPYISIILKGGYYEITPVFNKSGMYVGPRGKWYGPGSILFRRAGSWHRLVLDSQNDEGKEQPATTLFITLFGKRQSWGFMPQPERNKVYYREYFKETGQ